MSTVRRKSRPKPRPPITWPAWTDEHVWQLGPAPDDAGPYLAPSEADREWWAAQQDAEEPDQLPDDSTLEDLAGMHAAMARMERGLKD